MFIKSRIGTVDGIPEHPQHFMRTHVDRRGDCVNTILLTEVALENLVDQSLKRLSDGSFGGTALRREDSGVRHVSCTETARTCSS